MMVIGASDCQGDTWVLVGPWPVGVILICTKYMLFFAQVYAFLHTSIYPVGVLLIFT